MKIKYDMLSENKMYGTYFPKDCRKCIYLTYKEGLPFCKARNRFIDVLEGFASAMKCENYREREVSLRRFLET
jgi:hypothetical protein